MSSSHAHSPVPDAEPVHDASPDKASSSPSPKHKRRLCPSWTDAFTFNDLNPLFLKGYRNPLSFSDLPEVDPSRRADVLYHRLQTIWDQEMATQRVMDMEDEKEEEEEAAALNGGASGEKEKNKTKKKRRPWLAAHPLFRAVWKTYGTQYFWAALPRFFSDTSAVVSPMVLSQLVSYLQNVRKPDFVDNGWWGYILAIILLLLQLTLTLGQNRHLRATMTVGFSLRSSLISVMYRKSLRLSSLSRQRFNAGRVANMMATDTNRLDLACVWLHAIWGAPYQIIFATCLLVYNVGWAALVGVSFLIAYVPLQYYLTNQMTVMRTKGALLSDQRVKVTQEIFQGIRSVKFFNWEKSFRALLGKIRRDELRFIRLYMLSRAWIHGITSVMPTLAMIFTFVSYRYIYGPLDAAKVFSSLSLFYVMRIPLIWIPFLVSMGVDAYVSLGRIESLMMADELDHPPLYLPASESDPDAIRITETADFAWETLVEGTENDLTNRKMATAETLVRETGDEIVVEEDTSESGGSSTVKAVKKEKKGGMWKEFKDGGAEHDHRRKVIVPTLKEISFTIPRGQLVAIVGPVGAGKSSLINALVGEMKRVNLPREYGPEESTNVVEFVGSVALCPQTAWVQSGTVRDNILFGREFDKERYEAVIDACALRADLRMFPAGDQTELGERGVNLSGGQKQRVNIARACYANPDIVLLDDPLSAVDAHVGRHLFEKCIGGQNALLKGKTRVLVTHQLHFVPQVDYVYVLEKGRIVERGTFKELMDAHNAFSKLMQEYGGIGTGSEDENPEAMELEPTDKGEKKDEKLIVSEDEKEIVIEEAGRHLMLDEERAVGAVAANVYLRFLKYGGGWVTVCLALLATVLTQVSRVLTDVWLSWWVGDALKLSSDTYMAVYGSIGSSQIIFMLSLGFVVVFSTALAAQRLHDRALESVLRANMRFFESTPLGRLINRFSRDLDTIDTMLAESTRGLLFAGSLVISSLLTVAVVFPAYIGAFLPLCVVYYFLQGFYRTTARELKRMDSVTRSPIMAHYTETLTGLTTIRAYAEVPRFSDKVLRLVDENNTPYFCFLMAQRWIALRVEVLAATLLFFAALFAAVFRTSVAPGLAGLVVSYSLMVTQVFQWVIMSIVDTEANFNSTERLMYYVDEIPSEAPEINPEYRPPGSNDSDAGQVTRLPLFKSGKSKADSTADKSVWPDKGQILIQNLNLRYAPELPLVLRDVSLKIDGGEKIGIVGRTGAGKSSIILALLRLVEPESGSSILVDGVELTKLGLSDFRSRIAVIAQEPYLFSGTIRRNLDPFEQHTDEEIWDALDSADLKPAIMAMPKRLEAPVAENGENFSAGQKQLMCLARAMLKKARIVILDEATASVDLATDDAIQRAIRGPAFQGSTILTIAHRLNTIIDYDRVLVLDQGRVAEFDRPAALLGNDTDDTNDDVPSQRRIFNSMVEETGPVNSALLKSMASKAVPRSAEVA
ncbi:P-loop containing nucleoside triphosphate hydrolase protein [Cladochytrium replicatum]|nr:P-loop containing nucleoside triphosphate hydrolase protein [Cladochytrium replicatum]